MTNPHKILVVDDEPAIARALEVIFRKEGFDVLVAGDGQEGLATALREHPDAIVLDIVMPKLGGLNMLLGVRTDGGEWGKNVKAIVYTNLSYNEKREQARIVGVADFLVKANVRIGDVVKRVKEELGMA